MRKILTAAFVVLAATLSGVAADAGPPDKELIYPGIDFPDNTNGFVVFLNTTREAVCTDEQVAAEFAFFDWFINENGGAFFQYLDENNGDPTGYEGTFPPDEPPRPDGIVAFRQVIKETGKGAIVQSAKGTNVPTELWRQSEDALGVGPCTDTLGQTEVYATGTSMTRGNDNDLFGSQTRGNSFGNSVKASMTDADGNDFIYVARFHVSSRCHAPADGPPACLIESNIIR